MNASEANLGTDAAPAPACYHRPDDISSLAGSVTARVLDKFGIPNERTQRWQGQ